MSVYMEIGSRVVVVVVLVLVLVLVSVSVSGFWGFLPRTLKCLHWQSNLVVSVQKNRLVSLVRGLEGRHRIRRLPL